MNKKLDAYKKSSIEAKVMGASPHELVRLLFEKLCEKIETGLDSVTKLKNRPKKIKAAELTQLLDTTIQSFHHASNIAMALKDSVKKEPDEKLHDTLCYLYDHIQYYALDAARHHQPASAEQALKVSRELLSAWENIPAEYHYVSARQ